MKIEGGRHEERNWYCAPNCRRREDRKLKKFCDITIAGELKHGKGNVTEESIREECKGYEIVVLGDENAGADTLGEWIGSGMKFIGVAKERRLR